MIAREFVFENLTGDLEYHPKRALVYLALGFTGMCVWFFVPWLNKYGQAALSCAFGSAIFIPKAAFLLRKSSDGLAPNQALLGLSQTEAARPVALKVFPSIPALIAQMIQDFGTGDLLGVFVLRAFNPVDPHRTLPIAGIAITGAALFALGWFVRHFSSPTRPPPPQAIREEMRRHK